VASLIISPVGTLAFDPEGGRTLESEGNVVVHGRLARGPATATAEHRLVFRGVDERRFAGGGMDPLDSDVGLWVMGAGVLDAAGTPKRAWSRLADPARARTSSITVADPSGWQVGDEIVVTPTEDPSVPEHHLRHDRRRIASISGTEIALDTLLAFPHPAVEVAPGHTMRAEVLNLTRNVRIEGTPDGRAHVFVRAGRQTISHVELAHVGPRQPTPNPQADSQKVLGRYGLHFHIAATARVARRSRAASSTTPATMPSCPTRPTASRSATASPTTPSRSRTGGTSPRPPITLSSSAASPVARATIPSSADTAARHSCSEPGRGTGPGTAWRRASRAASAASAGTRSNPRPCWPEASGLVAHNINGPGIKV
jgi:hypothetical protein